MSSSNGVSKDAFANSGTANTMANTYGANAAQENSVLTPTLTRMATDPTGFSKGDLTAMNTAALQSAGGGQAAATGQGNLMAARTNNAGGYQAAVADAAHSSSNALSDAALRVQGQNALVKQQQQQEGLQGLSSMYGQNVYGQNNALGLSNQALQVANQGKQTAVSDWMAPWNAITQGGNTSANILGAL